MKLKWGAVLCCLKVLLIFGTAVSEPLQEIDANEKCPVCGMFVAKYDQWLTQIVNENETPLVFDGVKDMMAYYFNYALYGGDMELTQAEIWVRNYYTLDYINGRTAFYVVGSDVLGPMGDELIPFSTLQEAENFKKDHQGTTILRFDEIGAAQIMEMKKKHMMKMKKKKVMKQAN
ncbi:MAG: nitrous oxide reductase accessory protein NosL [Desulfofustis sp.]|nr:nitrous oxide reductase accessory protein NosL [Desulfofustis sp.]NNK55745.1 NosL family protein [Desulfofustis sp.]